MEAPANDGNNSNRPKEQNLSKLFKFNLQFCQSMVKAYSTQAYEVLIIIKRKYIEEGFLIIFQDVPGYCEENGPT